MILVLEISSDLTASLSGTVSWDLPFLRDLPASRNVSISKCDLPAVRNLSVSWDVPMLVLDVLGVRDLPLARRDLLAATDMDREVDGFPLALQF